jgi:lipoprotein-releasing system permease protein
VLFEWFVSLRFLRAGKTQTLLIFVGVAFGVAVMVFVGALIDGLQANLIRQTLSAQPHVIVRPPERDPRDASAKTDALQALRVEKAVQHTATIDQWQVVEQIVRSVPGVTATAPTVAGSAFVSKGSISRSVALRGVDPTTYIQIIPIDQKIRRGSFRLVGTEAVIGTELAKDLGVSVGDKLRMVSTEGRDEIVSISGVFDIGNKDLNQRWVFVSIRSAQTLLELPGSVSTIEAKVNDVFRADWVASQAAARTGLDADSWMKLNAQLLIALKSQSSSSYMIQFFVMLTVMLGIASVLVVSVVQKSKEIGILKATGTTTRSITKIFMIQGAMVGIVGSLLGSLVGTGLSLLFASLAKNSDGSPTFPVDLGPTRFALAFGVALTVGLLAAVAPARRAASLDPAKVIRYG